ncbi:MAG: hypothetical protein QG594_1869 [Bacteroidota bacterium]|jgi:hypothetical protein|nr:hypothetical protein [Bacteroidota bacterium]
MTIKNLVLKKKKLSKKENIKQGKWNLLNQKQFVGELLAVAM